MAATISDKTSRNESDRVSVLNVLGLKSGDLLFFSGHSVLGNLIKLFTRSKWSHIALVVRSENNDLFCYEADVDSLSDFLKKQGTGVRMIPLTEKINQYPGEVALRILNVSQEQELKTMQQQLIEFTKIVKNLPYEKSLIEFIRAAYDGPFGENVNEDLSSIFCSELVAAAYQHMGLLLPHPPGLSSNEYTPADFARTTLKLLKGDLSDIITIKPMKPSQEFVIAPQKNTRSTTSIHS